MEPRRTSWMRCIILCIVIVIVIILWCRFLPCPICPEPPQPGPVAKASLVLEAPTVATWIPTESGYFFKDIDPKNLKRVCQDEEHPTPFAECETFSEYNRPGIMAQIGRGKRGGNYVNYFHGVYLKYSSGEEITLEGTDFDWLDVRAKADQCVIDPYHAYALFDNPYVNVGCEGAPIDDAYKHCLRNQEIHFGLKPDIGLITYWPDSSFYTVHPEQFQPNDPNPQPYLSYVFEMPDPVIVDQWHQGCFVVRHRDVVEVRVTVWDDDSDHLVFGDPPTDGGGISFP